MRPLRLNADSSAISRVLPQRGHLGRPKLWAAGSRASQASCKVIVDPPRRSHTHPVYPQCNHHARPLWRCHDAIMKLSWPVGATFGGNDNGCGRICIKTAVGARFWFRKRRSGRDSLAHHDAADSGLCGLCPGRASASLRCSSTRRAAVEPGGRAPPVYSAACASTCWRRRGMTSSAMSCIDCRSHASLGPSQSTPVMSSVPKGPTSSRNATSLSSMVFGEP
jgi:hypothetical protein